MIEIPVPYPFGMIYRCFCFQPSELNGSVSNCRHAELHLQTRIWAVELRALFSNEAAAYYELKCLFLAEAKTIADRLVDRRNALAAWRTRELLAQNLTLLPEAQHEANGHSTGRRGPLQVVRESMQAHCEIL